MSLPPPVKVFVSYAHQDEAFRRELADHLGALHWQNWISTWSDHAIRAGESLEPAIRRALEAAHVHLLLVSPSFVNSEFCRKETNLILERHHARTTRAIPIVIRPVDWLDLPLAKLLALPRDARPVTLWSDRDEAWLDVARGIRAVIQDMRETPQSSTDRHASVPLQGSLPSAQPLDLGSIAPVSWDQVFLFMRSHLDLPAGDARKLAESWVRSGMTEGEFAHFAEVFGWLRSQSGMGLDRGDAFRHGQTLSKKWGPHQFAKVTRRYATLRAAGEGRWEALKAAEALIDLP
ncbi:MAG TPA: toll/interleukin-1 receptor domain-containing protein [Candidatus Thermoplasmatota archaeon]|nr:toll/interleukin-1 receptor domain-containing protein [Candidatus Thermoplasmatota archaeon]